MLDNGHDWNWTPAECTIVITVGNKGCGGWKFDLRGCPDGAWAATQPASACS